MKLPDGKNQSPDDCARNEAEQKQELEQNRRAERERNLVRDLSFIAVGIPLFAWHWRMVRKKD